MEAAPASRKQQTRDRILDTAAGVLRQAGFAGVGVADIMQRAGLTHGGFYAHFPSRDALLAQALARAGEDSQARMQRNTEAAAHKGISAFRGLVQGYLSEAHLRSPESGCPVAALLSDLPRQSDAVREAGAERVQSLIGRVAQALGPGHGEEDAALAASQLVGALQIARALGDNARGKRHLAAAREALLQQYDRPPPRRR
jgi:AcrR family transcriptional regulator